VARREAVFLLLPSVVGTSVDVLLTMKGQRRSEEHGLYILPAPENPAPSPQLRVLPAQLGYR
jgi:hypothetical protein